MLDGLVFCRKKPGGNGGAAANSDALFSRVQDNKTAESLSLRINKDVMRRLRWMIDDYVVLSVYDNGQRWVVKRVPGPKQMGMKISGKDGGHGTVRFTADAEALDLIFAGDNRSFTATLCDNDGEAAVFLKD